MQHFFLDYTLPDKYLNSSFSFIRLALIFNISFLMFFFSFFSNIICWRNNCFALYSCTPIVNESTRSGIMATSTNTTNKFFIFIFISRVNIALSSDEPWTNCNLCQIWFLSTPRMSVATKIVESLYPPTNPFSWVSLLFKRWFPSEKPSQNVTEILDYLFIYIEARR